MRKQKMNWLFFLNNKGEVDGGGVSQPESVHEAIMEADFDKLADGDTHIDDTPPVEKEDVKPESLIEVEGYKGPDRRAKGYAGEKRRQADKALEDPEFEMGFEIENGKKAKLKLSDLKEAAEYLGMNRNAIISSMKIRELAGKNQEFGKLLNGVLTKSFNENGEFNNEFISKQIKNLENKVDIAEGKIEDKDDEIAKAEELLNSDDIDPDSVQAQVLKSNIAAMKAQRNQLKQALDKIDEVSKKFQSVEKNTSDFLTKQKDAHEQVEINRISDVFNKEFKNLTDKSKENALQFLDDSELKDFEAKVRESVVKLSSNVKNDEEFINLVRESVKSVYDGISKRRESVINDYLRKKGQRPAGESEKADDVDTMKRQLSVLEKTGKGDSKEAKQLRDKIEAKKQEDDDPLKGKSMGEAIAEAMFAE